MQFCLQILWWTCRRAACPAKCHYYNLQTFHWQKDKRKNCRDIKWHGLVKASD